MNWISAVTDELSDLIKAADADRSKIDLRLNGLSFDLINMRPELCFSIIIDDEKFFEAYKNKDNNYLERELYYNYEYEGGSIIDVESAFERTRCVQSGGTALHLGTQLFERRKTLLRLTDAANSVRGDYLTEAIFNDLLILENMLNGTTQRAWDTQVQRVEILISRATR